MRREEGTTNLAVFVNDKQCRIFKWDRRGTTNLAIYVNGMEE
jgi:hypothetical protein